MKTERTHEGNRSRARNVVCLAVAFAAMSLFADTWTDGAGVKWGYSVSEGEATICGPGDSLTPAIPQTTKGIIEIPETLGGYPVTRIGDYAFIGCANLTGVVIPESVVSIGWEAFFDCSSLEEIRIPDSVEEIESAAFGCCDSLRSVELPQVGVDEFTGAFDTDTPGMCVTLRDGVGNIRDKAFQGCIGLASVTIPDSVTNIGISAFFACASLTSMEIPASVEKIGVSAFAYCSSLEEFVVDEGNANYEVVDGLLVAKNTKTVISAPGVIESVRIPSGVKAVGKQAFLGCENLASLVIPGWVSVIGDDAFAECKALSKLTISEGVESIGAGAFYDCSALKSVRLPASLKQLDDYAFGKCKNLKLVVMPRIEYGELVFKNSNPGLVIRYLDEEPPAAYKLTVKANSSKYGTVSGGGEYEPGTKVTLKAKANDGYVFAGWHSDKACTVALNPKGYDNRKPAVKIEMPAKKTALYAKFITKAADKKALKFTSKTKELAKTAAKAPVNKPFSLKLGIKSASYPTVTAKGLPSGLSIDKTTGKITGKATKAGSYTVTVKVKDYAGYVISQKVKIRVR